MKQTLLPLLFSALLLSSCIPEQSVSRPPNLLIVLSDQHSYDMLGCYGNDQVKTPNLDKFAGEGLRFDNCFSNQPVCTPFRGMLLSGMHPLKNGAFVNDVPLIPQPSLLGNVLKSQGYQTAYIGKWHLLGGDRKRPIPDGELRYGFDKVLTNNCHVDFRPGKCFFWNEKGEREYFDEWEVYGQTRQALQYLDEVDKEKPFALIVSWHPPHDWGKFKGVDGKMHYRYETMSEFMALYNKDSIELRPGIEVTPDRKTMYHGYMAMVSGVDEAFGMLMDKLEELGLEENTLTVFSADHGDMLESHEAVLPKQYIHDYSTRIPFLMRYPEKIKSGDSTSLLMSTINMLPTFLGMMGIETSFEYDGTDLSQSILEGDEDAVESIPVWVYQRAKHSKVPNWRGIITKDYSFAMTENMSEESIGNVLFDRKNDPNQLENLINTPGNAAIQKQFEVLTRKWMSEFSDDFYNAEDFRAATPEGDWAGNYTTPPLELLKINE
ncbi:sulfatase family protein [Marinoscillum furvescens]|uniref:Arylsulfatase A-like enzyme n=1 Tax=Marinoscillum furvescens DSM 4134 TaxID=1122208 RepID=A0A3D9L2X6_MARFU|nr:sulfatase [Marinoscillum furvescens]RED98366.1 arylsulfatase A-like enzyme [Marinoscillum furvescens DSM 4134]